MTKAEPIRQALWIAMAPAVLAGLAMFPGAGGPTICPFALLTGTACPGCGLTRAGVALVRGDVAGAFAFHPLVVPVALALGAAWLVGLARRRGRRFDVDRRLIDRAVLVLGVLFAVTWLIRLATGSLPPV